MDKVVFLAVVSLAMPVWAEAQGGSTTTTTTTTTASAPPSAAPATAAVGPLTLSGTMTPGFAWQGQSVVVRFMVSNPHAVDVTNVEFSDELSPSLAFVEMAAENGGRFVDLGR